MNHLGVVHWTDEYGNAMIRSLLEAAAEIHPALSIVATAIPGELSSDEDYKHAINVLAQAKSRWFFMLSGGDTIKGLFRYAIQKKIAGTGEHVWIIFSGAAASFLSDALNQAYRGGFGIFQALNARPGFPVFDSFVRAWKALGSSEDDLAFLQETIPNYPNHDFQPPPYDSSFFELDPSILASTTFDSTILMGLSIIITQLINS